MFVDKEKEISNSDSNNKLNKSNLDRKNRMINTIHTRRTFSPRLS